jgi:plasmid maintenance system killer protein
MEVLFESEKLKKTCDSEKELRRIFGPEMAKKIQQRLSELAASPTLKDMEKVPAARCHELRADRSGQFAVKLAEPKRLVFKPAHDPVPRLPGGNIDARSVTKILVLEIVDYHGN